MEKRKQNVVLFPFMAQGHIIPFLALAKQIQEQKRFSITFVNTPLNIRNLQKSLPESFSSASITFAELPFNSSDHGLPPEVENTDTLPYSLYFPFFQATSSLSLPFKQLLSNLVEKPICVISDFFFDWVAGIAHEFGIFHAVFSPTGGFGMACYYSMWLSLPHKRTKGEVEFLLPDFPEAGKIHITQVLPPLLAAEENGPAANFHRKMFAAWGNSDGLLLNTVEELDEKGLMYFRRKLGIPVWGIGPLLLPEKNRARPSGRESTISAEECIEWLDKKEENSVLYISFGSQNTISASQMMKLAKALDASGKNFIWVVRPPLEISGDLNAEQFVAEKWLPEGFVQRVQEEDRGLIINKWAPQMEILGHKSVAAFISHCGWNSVVEALKNGVPILSWPLAADQFFNSKFLAEEVGVCVEMARGSNAEVVEEDMVEKIELVMGNENGKGKKIRMRGNEVKETVRDAMRDDDEYCYKVSSVKAMDEFFNAAKLLKFYE